ncbi:MAG: hypothetical protein HZA61_10170 [Candidatus Eisenbacteria bacterium]|uniref:FlgD Ig-like domain-containing protein n=1 Tax=Eiseniibacteriota bacterium TaxID=2212470 RepID=A0A933W8T4_UNCEI|nr:hypothetical protein [Candidatus Eisenbacteria bacterium]
MTTFPRISLLALTSLAALSLTAASGVSANELSSSARANGIVIHSAEETLRDYCSWNAGRLYLNIPGGASYELVTTVTDPAIVNKGDGSFHPYDAAEVRSALNGVRYPLQRVAAEVFVLPYPRRNGLDSAAGPGLILLSPGVRPLSLEQQHAEFTHELGHVVQYTVLPDADTTGWNRYRRLRNLDATYAGAAAHSDRPHEIFAEDFRVLFGDALANYSGTIENADLAYPTTVSGLDAFLVELADAPVAMSSLRVAGSGYRGAVQFTRDGMGASSLELYDVTGRHLTTLAPVANGSSATWNWDGRDSAGRAVKGEVVFARARDGRGGIVRVTRL